MVTSEQHASSLKGTTVGITHNGYQWSTMYCRTRKELKLLQSAIGTFLRTGRKVLVPLIKPRT